MKASNNASGWLFAISCPYDGIDWDSLSRTPSKAWERFCYPALKREAYEAKGSGYYCKRISAKQVLRRLKSKKVTNENSVRQ